MISNRNIKLAAVFVFTTLMLLSGCKSKKQLADTGGTLEKKAMKNLVEDVLVNQLQYTTLDSKINITFRSGSSEVKLPAVFKLVKDSAIQLSVRIPILGGEAFRLHFTPDSVLAIDRMNKKYALSSIGDFGMFRSMDASAAFANLQALFTNNLFLPGKQSVQPQDWQRYSLSATKEVYLLSTQDSSKKLSFNFAVDASDHIASTLITSQDKSLTLQWSYANFVKDDERQSIYPTQMDLKADIAKKRFDLGLEFSKINFDQKNFKVDTSIPSKYEKVSLMDLIETLTKKMK